MNRLLSIALVLAPLAACGPSGRVLFDSFDPNEEFLRTQPAGDRAYWVRGTEVWAIDPGATDRGAELVTGSFTDPSKLSLLVDDEHVFVWDRGDVLRTRRDGSERVTLTRACIGFELVDDGDAFVCERQDPSTEALSLVRISKETGETLLEVAIDQPGEVVTSATHLYFVREGELVAFDKTSRAVASVAPIAPPALLLGLEYLGGKLYWTDGSVTAEHSRLRSYDPSSQQVADLGDFGGGGGLYGRGEHLYLRDGPGRIARYDVVRGETETLGYVPRLYHFAVTDTHVVAATDGRLIGFER